MKTFKHLRGGLMSRTLSILLMAMMISPGMAQYGGDTEAFAADDTYTVSYEYMGDYPSAVMRTLPEDSNLYTDGQTVRAKQPSDTSITVDGITYTFEGWGVDEVEVNGKDIIFVGTWEDSNDEGTGADDEDEEDMEPEDEIPDNPQPADPNAAEWASATSTKTSASTGRARLFHFDDDTLGTGICAYHTRHGVKKRTSGWLREITPDQANYEEIKRLIYWGIYKREGSMDNRTTYKIHIYLSYLRNGDKSLSDQRKNRARFEKDCAKFVKNEVPDPSFKIYEWIPEGKTQIVITYRAFLSGYVQILKTSAQTDTKFLEAAPFVVNSTRSPKMCHGMPL